MENYPTWKVRVLVLILANGSPPKNGIYLSHFKIILINHKTTIVGYRYILSLKIGKL